MGKMQEQAQEIADAPHSTVVKAIVSGEKDDADGVVGKRILSFIQRVERLQEEQSELAQDIKEIFAEAKATGFDTKIIRRIIRERKIELQKRREEQMLLDTYKAAIGME